jgi:hypothetical protein
MVALASSGLLKSLSAMLVSCLKCGLDAACQSPVEHRGNSYGRRIVIVLITFCLCAIPEVKSRTKDFGPREALLSGQQVEFTEQGGIIKAKWIEEAVRKHVKIGVTNATIDGDLDLKYEQVENELALFRCEFTGSVDFSYATFRQNIILDQAAFDKNCAFNSLTCENDFSLKGADFRATQPDKNGNLPQQIADFSDLRVKGAFSMDNAHFEKDVEANFNRVTPEWR